MLLVVSLWIGSLYSTVTERLLAFQLGHPGVGPLQARCTPLVLHMRINVLASSGNKSYKWIHTQAARRLVGEFLKNENVHAKSQLSGADELTQNRSRTSLSASFQLSVSVFFPFYCCRLGVNQETSFISPGTLYTRRPY